ncbi:MAG: hypothetical protein JXX14_02220 [Deltaproteobacteria bacterium]|nr:hypothetical protein [Deltaproteobacteria bacterium]
MSSYQKSVYMNLFILALADGKLDPREMHFLARFASEAGISDAMQQEWQQEAKDKQLQFVPIESDEIISQSLALLARMVRVDDEFDPREQDAYLSMGKALGYSEEELGTALRKYWNTDPQFDLSTVIQQTDDGSTESAPVILVIQDYQTDLEKLELSANRCKIDYCRLSETSLQSDKYTMVLFQIPEDPKDSLAMLNLLKQHFVKTPVGFLAHRAQAAQIGYLLENGANKCFVKPLFPNELNKALKKVISARK